MLRPAPACSPPRRALAHRPAPADRRRGPGKAEVAALGRDRRDNSPRCSGSSGMWEAAPGWQSGTAVTPAPCSRGVSTAPVPLTHPRHPNCGGGWRPHRPARTARRWRQASGQGSPRPRLGPARPLLVVDVHSSSTCRERNRRPRRQLQRSIGIVAGRDDHAAGAARRHVELDRRWHDAPGRHPDTCRHWPPPRQAVSPDRRVSHPLQHRAPPTCGVRLREVRQQQGASAPRPQSPDTGC